MCIAPDAVHFRLPYAACTSFNFHARLTSNLLQNSSTFDNFFLTLVCLIKSSHFKLPSWTILLHFQFKPHPFLPSYILLTGKSFSVSILVTPLNSTFLYSSSAPQWRKCVTLWLKELGLLVKKVCVNMLVSLCVCVQLVCRFPVSVTENIHCASLCSIRSNSFEGSTKHQLKRLL